MGTSTRYSSATDKPELLSKDIADASGSSPISAPPTDDILLALARVEQSLRTVLAHIAAMQREMGISQSSIQPAPATAGVPLKPDNTWNGSP